MNLIDTNIQPDPFDPQRGDVYEFGAPFPQRIVVEDPPTAEDPRIRYRVDGGADSNFTSLGQFHLHLAGLGELRGVGRVREYPPITADQRQFLVHQLRSTALGVDPIAADLMRAAAATIVEQAAALHAEVESLVKARANQQLTKAENNDRAAEMLKSLAERFQRLSDAVMPRGPKSDIEMIQAATSARRVFEQVDSAIKVLGFAWDPMDNDAGNALMDAVKAERTRASNMALELDSISAFIAPRGVQIPAGHAGDAVTPTSLELVRWLAVTGGVDPRSCHPTIIEVKEAQEEDARSRWAKYKLTDRPVSERLTWEAQFNDIETELTTARREHAKFIQALRDALGVDEGDLPDIVRAQMQEKRAAEGRFANASAILDMLWPVLEQAARRSGLERTLANAELLLRVHNPRDEVPNEARPTNTPLHDEVQRTVEQLRGFAARSNWPVREALHSAAAVMLEAFSAKAPAPPTPSFSKQATELVCNGSVTVLAVKDRLLIQRQQWTSGRPGFQATDVSFNDDDPCLHSVLGFGERMGKWTWRGIVVAALGAPVQWQGEWTEEKE